jgi:anti-anti-sigma regulatory factor
MPIEKWSDNVLVVHLADDPQLTDDLESLAQFAQPGGGGGKAANGGGKPLSAVLDFTGVSYINSSNIAKLLRVRQATVSSDGRLILCGMGTQVWSAFLITGLDKVFNFSDNVTTALATIQMA